jgi:predicted nucleic acid-binding protein
VIVVDNSVLVAALAGTGATGKARATRLFGEKLIAPALIDHEAVNTLRGLVLGRKLAEEDAERAVRLLPVLRRRRRPQ